ncbi:hypothetical protein VMCG_07911 [Cytospora schulzeri]|uniref:Uncharacterized protein n=1 Tax=Cytospora schulzeri TaxID=448051 RepID=A0A423W0C5_9PEZI|nr:hypothetical protein VMCG_07911 [Valsa malicola]
MARFHWEVQYIEAGTRMYQALDGRGIAPKFLGHIHEEYRVIGIHLEKIPDGRNAEAADLEILQLTIRPDGQVVLIDFEKAKTCADPAVMEAEIASLEGQMAEMTGRGGGPMPYEEGDSD